MQRRLTLAKCYLIMPPANASEMKRNKIRRQYVVCVANRGYRVSLVVRRLYPVIPDKNAEQRGLIRVVDESGDDYLYPNKVFAAIDLPSALARKFAVAT